MYERTHSEGEEIPIEEWAIAAIEKEICETEKYLDNELSKLHRHRQGIAQIESYERYALSKIEVLTETVERLKEEL